MDRSKYKRAFDSVHAPEDTEARVLNALSQRPKGVQQKFALILCAVLILTCSAALATGGAGQWLSSVIYMNGREFPADNLQKIGRTVENSGMRLTLDSVASDGVHTYFLLDIEALNDQDLSNTDPETIPMEDSLPIAVQLELPSSGGYSYRAVRIDDGSDPARAQLILKFDFGVPRNGSRLTLTVHDVCRGIWTTNEAGKRLFATESLAEGAWTFSIRLSSNLDGVHYGTPGYDFDISISPLGMSINGVGSKRFGREAVLLMQDGAQIELTRQGYSSGTKNGELYRELVSYDFPELIDPVQAAALISDGVEYPLVR